MQRGVTDSAQALRMEFETMKRSAVWGEIGDDTLTRAYEQAIHDVEAFVGRITDAVNSNRYSSLGLADLSREGAKPLHDLAARLDAQAGAITSRLTIDGERRWQEMAQPPSNQLEAYRLVRLQARLEAEDELIREQFLLECARRGGDDTLRAARTFLMPPLDLGTAARWRPLLSDSGWNRVRSEFLNAVSPVGPEMWRAHALTGIAEHLRAVANVEV